MEIGKSLKLFYITTELLLCDTPVLSSDFAYRVYCAHYNHCVCTRPVRTTVLCDHLYLYFQNFCFHLFHPSKGSNDQNIDAFE